MFKLILKHYCLEITTKLIQLFEKVFFFLLNRQKDFDTPKVSSFRLLLLFHLICSNSWLFRLSLILNTMLYMFCSNSILYHKYVFFLWCFYAIINLKIVNFYKPWSNMKILMLFHDFDVIDILFHDFDVLDMLFHDFDVINLSIM